MNIKYALSVSAFSVYMTGVSMFLGGCSSVPTPTVPDGLARVAVNDPNRVRALQDQVAQDRKILTENNLLKAQVEVLQQRLAEMSTLARETLLLQRSAPPVHQATTCAPVTPQSIRSKLPLHAFSATASGTVIRVFHPFGRTDFEPSEPVVHALRVGVQGAEHIEVRGHTDSNVINPVDRRIARERAEKARLWLINNGVDAAKIHTRYFTTGKYLTENQTEHGRSLNRRVEIDIHNPRCCNKQIALSN